MVQRERQTIPTSTSCQIGEASAWAQHCSSCDPCGKSCYKDCKDPYGHCGTGWWSFGYPSAWKCIWDLNHALAIKKKHICFRPQYRYYDQKYLVDVSYMIIYTTFCSCSLYKCNHSSHNEATPVEFKDYNDRQKHYAGFKRPQAVRAPYMDFEKAWESKPITLIFKGDGIYHKLTWSCCPLCRQLSSDDPTAEFGVPEEILNAWKGAVQSKSRTAKNALFTAFLKAGKNWAMLLDRMKYVYIYICVFHFHFFWLSYCMKIYMIVMMLPPNVLQKTVQPHPRLHINHSRSRAERTTGETKYGSSLRYASDVGKSEQAFDLHRTVQCYQFWNHIWKHWKTQDGEPKLNWCNCMATMRP